METNTQPVEINKSTAIKSLTDLTTRDDIGYLLNSLGLKDFGLEIGVAYGENAENILKYSSLRTLFLVDPWKKWDPKAYQDGTSVIDFDGAYMYCLEKLKTYSYGGRVSVLRLDSNEAYSLVNGMKLDFVYIDGNHHEPQVSQDLENYFSLVKEGGILGGHDYYNCDTLTKDGVPYLCEVKSAVDAFVKRHNLDLHVTTIDDSWWIQK
jgi:hypothetical protein